MIDVQHCLIEEYIRAPDIEGTEGLPMCDGRTSGKQTSVGNGDGAKAKSGMDTQ
ncbi:hypothetical protein [Arthrobacter sp. NPDC093139]|uniref:hypothetical protein n=1 Tax=Arthrobacter sp. NPDC093139 TaxID=3363945 RepID=UPI00382FD166